MYMSQLFAVAVAVAMMAVASGKNIRTSKNHVEMSSEAGEFLTRVLTMPGRDDMDLKTVFDLLSQVDDLLSRQICVGDKCGFCLKIPVLGETCFEVESVKNETGIHLILSRNGNDLICMTFGNSTPKICLFHHLCVQVTDIHIASGAICASLKFNDVTILHKCIHI